MAQSLGLISASGGNRTCNLTITSPKREPLHHQPIMSGELNRHHSALLTHYKLGAMRNAIIVFYSLP